MQTFARHLKFYVLLVVACAAFLAACELGLRWMLPDDVPSTADYEMLEADDVLGYRLGPSIDAVFERTPANGGDRIRWRTNARGFRGDELAATMTRIVVYGDSNVQAVFSTDANTFPERLESLVSLELGRPVEVVNAGVIGYGPDHYLLRMTADLPLLQPDLVVMTIFADNDLGDLLRHRLFEVRDGRLMERSDHVTYPRSSLVERARRLALRLLITRAALKALSAIGLLSDAGVGASEQPDTIAARIRQLDHLAALTFARYTMPGSEFLRGDYYDIDVAVAPESDAARAKLSLLAAILSEAKATADRAGVPLLVVIEPSRVDLTTLDPVNYETLAQAYASYDRRRLTRSIEELCRSASIDVINLYDTFSQNAPETLYFGDRDSHWNDAGQRLAAETVAPRVVARLLRAP